MKHLFWILTWPWPWSHEPRWWFRPHGWEIDIEEVAEVQP